MGKPFYVLMPGAGQDGKFIGEIELGLCDENGMSLGGLVGAKKFATAEEAAAYARKHNQISAVLQCVGLSCYIGEDRDLP